MTEKELGVLSLETGNAGCSLGRFPIKAFSE
jgi:hypothetical protein